MYAIWHDMSNSKELGWRLFLRDVSAQYRQSLLGIFWAFLPPIITSLIFILLQSRNVIAIHQTDIPYPVYVLIGTILWQVFADSINAPLRAVSAAKPFLVKLYFPRESLILSAFYSVIFNLLIRVLIIIGIFILFRLELSWGMLVAPFAILILIMLGMCIGLLLTPLGMLYNDVTTALPIAIQLLFFVTPVAYSLPESFPFSLINVINPISPLLVAARDLITQGSMFNYPHFLVVTGLTAIGIIFALIIFRVALPIIIERMSA